MQERHIQGRPSATLRGATTIARRALQINHNDRTLPIATSYRGKLIGDNCRRLITGQCTIKFTGNQCSSLFIGVDTICIVIRIWLQQCIKIHNGQMTFLRYTAYYRNNTVCNYAIVNTKIPFYGRNRQTKIYLSLEGNS